jgi:hypothetical protein
MKPASINEIKQELSTLPPKRILELCLRLAKYKKENKELLTYLLFEAHDAHGFVEGAKKEIDEQFVDLPKTNSYFTKKGLRKILRLISKYGKHVAKKESEVEMRLHFCLRFKNSGIPYRRNKTLSNMYDQQIKKLEGLIDSVHEDLIFDYKKQLDELI